MRVPADVQTDWQTQTDFIICPMLYAIAVAQITRYCSRNYWKKVELDTRNEPLGVGGPKFRNWFQKLVSFAPTL